MWNEYLLQVDPNYVIATTKESIYQQLKEISNQEIILSQSKNFNKDFPTSIKCFVYSINPVSNVQVIRKFSNKNHIFIGHGDNLKNSTVNKQFRIYDHYLAPGQAQIDRFEKKNIEVTKNFFRITGRPQTSKINHSELKDSGLSKNPKTVLYRPTFYGASLDKGVNSLENSLEIVKKLAELNLNIIFKPHPWSITPSDNYFYQHDFPLVQAVNEFLNNQVSDSDSNIQTNTHIFGQDAYDLDIYQVMNQSDFLISDLSYVTVDYLASNKAIILNSYLDNTQEFESKVPLSKSLYVLNKDLSNLDQVLNFALNDDYKKKERLRAKEYYLSKIKYPDQEFIRELKKFL